ncbi:unnamed protein product [Closterium sp. NIES-53]
MANASKFFMAAGAAGAAAGRSGAIPALLSRVFHAAVASRSLAPIAIATANIATSASVSAPTSGPTCAPVASNNSVSSNGEPAGAANAGISRSGSTRNLSTAAVAVQYEDNDDDDVDGEYGSEKHPQGYPSPFRRALLWQQQQPQWQQQKHALQEHAEVAPTSLAQSPHDDATALDSSSSSPSFPSFQSSASSSTPFSPSGGCDSTTEPFQTMPYASWESSHSSSHGSRRTQSGDGSSDSGVEHRALLVDAAGTLVEPSEPVTKVYASLGRKYGVKYSEDEILQRYRHAYIQPWRKSILRYEDDARPFWQYVVSESTGCNHPDYLEELYQYYTTKEAWRLTDPHAKEAFTAIRDAGVKIAVVSNFDTRLRTVLKELDCHDWFDAIAVSAEIQAEKPNPVIFHSACDLVGVDPHHAVHVGDDRRNDLWGARDAGCSAWLWQDDVHSFHDVARKLGVLFPGEEESPDSNKRRMRRPPRWAERPMIAANGLQGAESEGAESGGAEPRGNAFAGGPAGASPRLSHRREPLSLQQLRERFAQRTRVRSGAAGAGGSADGGTGASAGGVGGAGAGDPGAGGTGAGDPRAGGTGAGGAGAGGTGAGGAGAGGTGAGGAGASSLGGAGVPAGAGGTEGAGAAGPGGARTRGTGAAEARGVGGARAGDPAAGGTDAGGAGAGGAGAGGAGAGDPGAGGTGVGGARAGGTGAGGAGAGGTGAGGARVGGTGAGDLGAGGAGAGGAGAGGTGAGGTVQRRTFFVPPPPSSLLPPDSVLRQVLSLPSTIGLSPSLLYPPPHQSQPQLQPVSPQPAPSPYVERTDSPIARHEPESRPASPVRAIRTGRRVPRPRPPPIPDTHIMALPSAASHTVPRLLATIVNDPSFESTAASALVAELVDFAAACRLDCASSLVAESQSDCPPSVGGECALGTDVIEDTQEDFECLAAAVPNLVAMLLAPEGNLGAPDIPTPRSYAEAITGPYSSQWQSAMDAEMASWKVKRPPGSPYVFKAHYVARGFSQRQGVDFFHTFSPTPKMPTLRVLLHVTAQRDYELHSLDFSTAFLQGSLHEEIWLRRPPGFTWSFSTGTQWSLRRPLYGLHQAPREWPDTLRTTLAALGFAPSAAGPSLFLRTDSSLPPFYILVYDNALVFATADIEALTLVKSEMQKRHTCTDLAPPSDESVELSGPYPELVGCLIHRTDHMDAAKRVLRYLCTDDLTTQRSSQGYTFSLGSGSVSWRSTRSFSVLSSSCEAEIYAGSMVAQELRWLTYLLTDFGGRPRFSPILYQCGQFRLAYVATRANTVDVFTKALQSGDHQRFCTVLGLVPTLPHLLTA